MLLMKIHTLWIVQYTVTVISKTSFLFTYADSQTSIINKLNKKSGAFSSCLEDRFVLQTVAIT